jgi:hypothetical protein
MYDGSRIDLVIVRTLGDSPAPSSADVPPEPAELTRKPRDQRPRDASLARFSARFSSLVFCGFFFVSFFRSIPFDMTPAPPVGSSPHAQM